MTEIGALIRHLRLEAGLKQRQLAERIGSRPQRISNYERGSRYPTTKDAYGLSRYFERDVAEFLNPKEIGADTMSPVPVDDRNAAVRLLRAAAVHVRTWPVPVFEDKSWFCPNGCAYFGEPFLSLFGINPVRCVVAEMHDASMEPRLPEGCVVLIDRSKVPPNEALIERETYAVVRDDGELLIRRASHEQDGWVFRADAGSHYGVIRDRENVVVFGRVIWTSRIVGKALKPVRQPPPAGAQP